MSFRKGDFQAMTSRIRESFEDRHSGVAAVEFAIIAPILIVFVYAIIEINSAIYLRQSLTIAAYEGARVALLPNTNLSNVVAAGNRLLESRKINGANIKVVPENFGSASFGEAIRVEVTAPIAQNVFFNHFFSAETTLSASVTMMKER